jgi:hypothetical protein
MGATGTTLVGTLIDELLRRGARHGVVAVSGALGLGAAAVIEALQTQGVPIVAVGGAAAGPELAATNGLLVLPGNVVEAAATIARAVGQRG